MKYLILGTAGHIDHGKTTLIKALTGIDTDRLIEEKKRGISIDLGFAHLNLSEQITLGIVDVPGHERFLKNMLAGTGGIDIAMLVIAADEGIMPQTLEHLAMLNLLGIRAGLVALTKIDRVEEDWILMVEGEIRTALSDSFLKDAAICRISAFTGAGLTELKAELLNLSRGTHSRNEEAPFRLWIDRVFSAKGFGTVVTGTALSGKTAIGETLLLQPDSMPLKIRGLESHGTAVQTVRAGQRAAINVSGASIDDMSRGKFLSDIGRGQTTIRWDALYIGERSQEVINGTRIRFHIGTGEFIGRAYNKGDGLAGIVQLIFEKPVCGALADKGILRRYSPQDLLGGITLLQPSDQKGRRKVAPGLFVLAEAVRSSDLQKTIEALLQIYRPGVELIELRRLCGYINNRDISENIEQLINKKIIIRLQEHCFLESEVSALFSSVKKTLLDHHMRNSDQAGYSREILRQKLDVRPKIFDLLAGHWVKENLLLQAGGDLALSSHADSHESWRKSIEELAEKLFSEPGLLEIGSQLLEEKIHPASERKRIFDSMIRVGILIRVGEFYVYRKTIQYIVRLIQKHLSQNATISVAELRDILQTSRRIALPVMEYLDAHKYTVRSGDVRKPGPRLEDLSE